MKKRVEMRASDAARSACTAAAAWNAAEDCHFNAMAIRVYRLAVGLGTLACSQPSPCAPCSNQDEALSLDEGSSSCAHGRQIQQQATHLRRASGQLAASNHHTTPVRSSTYYRKPTTLALLTAAVAQLVTPGLSGSECGHSMRASGLAFLLGHNVFMIQCRWI
ncbi:hypothetical protein VFPBJ_07670 [Purpureocillium lilacinum]|uniref:Uncharacterized protein n=1 Tax=Purpureocillium lilacinum TaxID=33203 RepID=A0A179GI80_PURLI|nr:hypothetical protein VFPBJ_07670 [Purpureocillium lilacinum]